ncbi:hypothetical protein [Parasphingorhabdus sp.]|uniref:hypothetical protein n=1 Tax=Parasphingorhabdus sp. TaxID=2709688 RepID=UPI00300303C8
MTKFAILMSSFASITAGPLLAHEHGTEKSGEHKCEMMKDGKKMSGMMKKDADGKMSCQMMDHSKMDHSKMDHSKMPAPEANDQAQPPMDHSKMDHSKMDHSKMEPKKEAPE